MLDNVSNRAPDSAASPDTKLPPEKNIPQPKPRIASMTQEEKREYNRQAKERHKAKKRGETVPPKNSAAPEAEKIPPGDAPFTAKAEPGPKRRKASGPDKAQSIQKMAQFIGAFHMILASRIGPEMLLQESEAVALATSATELFEQYDYVLDPKTAALVGFVSVVGGVYVPRFMAVGARVANERQQAAQRRPAPPGGQQPGAAPVNGAGPMPETTAAPAAPHAPQVDVYGAPETTEAPTGQD